MLLRLLGLMRMVELCDDFGFFVGDEGCDGMVAWSESIWHW